MSNSHNASTPTIERGVWSTEEHDKFLDALKLYPEGPWRVIADFVGTRSARQVQTHAQKYYEKVARRVRGLRKDRKRVVRAEHRLDDGMATLCRDVQDDEDAVETAMALNTRRGIQAIAMRHHNESLSSPSPSADAKDARVELDNDAKMEDWSEEKDDGESDSSLSSLDDDCLSYLLQILESQDYANSDDIKSS